jgi:hypothetical protein
MGRGDHDRRLVAVLEREQTVAPRRRIAERVAGRLSPAS